MSQINSNNFFNILEIHSNIKLYVSVTFCVIIIYYLLIFFSLNL